jgi:Concanavalin A-like lectin/glucanases superfamily
MKSILLLALAFGSLAAPYDQLVTGDRPVFFYNDASGRDVMASHHNGVLTNGPGTTRMPDGGLAMAFNGVDQYLEILTDQRLSVPATGVLTIEAWLRPDTLDFEKTEGSGYVYWLGKGVSGSQEYAARIYGQHPTGHDQGRINRISGYAFNPGGGLGAGSYFQAPLSDPVSVGEWIHYVLIINTTGAARSAKYPTGYTKLYVTRKSTVNGQIVTKSDQDALAPYQIVPVAGSAPLRVGTRDLLSFMKGAIGKIAIYNYELKADQVSAHARGMFR